MQGVSWKTLYLERDERAVAEARHAAPSQELLPIYVQARKQRPLRTCQPACGATDPPHVPADGGGQAPGWASAHLGYHHQHDLLPALPWSSPADGGGQALGSAARCGEPVPLPRLQPQPAAEQQGK